MKDSRYEVSTVTTSFGGQSYETSHTHTVNDRQNGSSVTVQVTHSHTNDGPHSHVDLWRSWVFELGQTVDRVPMVAKSEPS